MNFIALAANTSTSSTAGQASMTEMLLTTILPFAIIILVMYFLMIRPQKKRQKEEEKMRNNIQVGDEIITIGGIYGRVISIKDDSIVIESTGDRTKIQVSRTSVGQNLTIHES